MAQTCRSGLADGAVDKVDVVIVGAGLAGLTAAEKIVRGGYSCRVLEARDRVGGRTWSQRMPSGEVVVDLGAAWINDTNQSCMYELAGRFGAELIEQNTKGGVVLQREDGALVRFEYGDLPRIDDATYAELARVRDLVEAECQQVDLAGSPDQSLDSITFAAYLRSRHATPTAIRTATVWTRAMLGQEPDDISALFFLQYCKAGGGLLQMRSDRKGGGQHLRIRQGTQHFANSLAAALPDGTVRLQEKVEAIHQTSPRTVRVQSSSGVVEAAKVICAVPPPILKGIVFDPPLPADTAVAISSYQYGFYMKVMIRFRKPFWVENGLCGLAQSFAGPAAIFRDTSVPTDGKHVLTCFLAGEPGLKWSKLSAESRKEALLKQIGEVFGEKQRAREEFEELLDYEWRTDAFTGFGCPSPALAPGVLSSIGTDWGRPVGGMHFAGTEFSNVWRGYMEGAVRSGEREGDAVLAELRHAVANL